MLVVDDEPVVLQVMTALLKSRGLTAVTETTGEAALERIASAGFGCVLVDKNLPGIDGLAVVRAVRKTQPHCATLVMTGYSSTASVLEALRLGATDYLEKPFADIELVFRRIESAMKSQRAQYERDFFVEKLKAWEQQLNAAKSTVEQQRTEIQLFEEVLDLRVRQATADLRQQLTQAHDALSSSGDFDFALKTNVETILQAVRDAQQSDDPAVGGARTMLARIAFRLEAHLLLLTRRVPLPDPTPGRK